MTVEPTPRDAYDAPAPGQMVTEAVPIARAEPPWRWRVAGTIEAICIDPRDMPSIEARVADGTGCLVARWRGWTSLNGLGVRKRVILEGFVDLVAEGQKLMLEPDYEIVFDG
jgi:hypothetical protein